MDKFHVNISDQVGTSFLQKAKVVLDSAILGGLFVCLIHCVAWEINEGESVASREWY